MDMLYATENEVPLSASVLRCTVVSTDMEVIKIFAYCRDVLTTLTSHIHGAITWNALPKLLKGIPMFISGLHGHEQSHILPS